MSNGGFPGSGDCQRKGSGYRRGSRLVRPRGEVALIGQSVEAGHRGNVTARDVASVFLATAEALMQYRPIDSAGRLTNLLVVMSRTTP